MRKEMRQVNQRGSEVSNAKGEGSDGEKAHVLCHVNKSNWLKKTAATIRERTNSQRASVVSVFTHSHELKYNANIAVVCCRSAG